MTTVQSTAVIGGVSTEFLISDYVNRRLCIITQTATFGTVMHIQYPLIPDISNRRVCRSIDTPEGDRDYVIQFLLGRRDVRGMEVLGRRLAEAMETKSDARSVVLKESKHLQIPTQPCCRSLILCLAIGDLRSSDIKPLIETAKGTLNQSFASFSSN